MDGGIRRCDGRKEVEQALVRVGIGDVESAAVFRVIVAEPDRQNAARMTDVAAGFEEMAKAFGQQVSVVQLPEGEILDDLPLVFASCDAILLSPAVQVEISEARAAALINGGARLVAVSHTAPAGKLSRLVWDRVQPAGTAQATVPVVWISSFTAMPPASGH